VLVLQAARSPLVSPKSHAGIHQKSRAQHWAFSALAFYFTTSDDPVQLERKRNGEKPASTLLELEPLKNIQVWRFSLYYFCVFGAFVAFALWLPQYLIHVYGVDIRYAGMIAAFFSIPASLFRAYGGHLSDVYGARKVMYWTFLVGSDWWLPSFSLIRRPNILFTAITARCVLPLKWAWSALL